jgi:hypothetical protein
VAEHSGKPTWDEPGCVVKFSWPEVARRNEVEVIGKAKKAGEGNEYIGDHIPTLKSWCGYDYFHTSHIRKDLSRIQKTLEIDVAKLCQAGKQELDTKGARILRILVFEDLVPITKLSAEDMYRVLWQCYFCHFYLWEADIHHGDISHNNLMAKKANGTWVGVLYDYDLAVIEDVSGERDIGMDRTGTQPFMALDLLKDIFLHLKKPRFYRYDSESFHINDVNPTIYYQAYGGALKALHLWWKLEYLNREATRNELLKNDVATDVVQAVQKAAKQEPHLRINLPQRAPFS